MAKRLNADQVFANINWCIADLKDVLKRNGIKPTQKNIYAILNNRCGRTLEERSTEEGWEILDVIVSCAKHEGIFDGE